MAENTTQPLIFPGLTVKDALTEILRKGARRMLTRAIEEEVVEWIERQTEGSSGGGRFTFFLAWSPL